MRGKILAFFTAALLVVAGGLTASIAQDVTDPITAALLPNDMITVVRNSHQRLAAPLYLLNPGALDQVQKCAMVAATTCTAVMASAYVNAPLCIAEDQSGFIVAHAIMAPASTTVTITAASSQSDTFVVNCNPFPN